MEERDSQSLRAGSLGRGGGVSSMGVGNRVKRMGRGGDNLLIYGPQQERFWLGRRRHDFRSRKAML